MKNKGKKKFLKNLLLFAFIFTGILLVRTVPVIAADAAEAQGIVDKARITFNSFMADKNYTWLHHNFKNTRGVLIYPQVLKAGFFLGGSAVPVYSW